jgi:aminoglycoside phosphotransferase (APT) family kinase protein
MTRWLSECSVNEVRRALAAVHPQIADLPIVLHDSWVDTGNPLWSRSSAFVGNAWVVKFAWSKAAAGKLEREIGTLLAIATSEVAPPVRRVELASSEPVLLVSPFVPGVALTGERLTRCSPAQKQRLAAELAEVLVALHDPITSDAVARAEVELPEPRPQATTDELRERFVPMLDPGTRELVLRWCDWTDAALAPPVEPVVLHGDFHGYNVVVDTELRVRVVLDLEEASTGDRHYDFRYLPAQEATLDLVLATIAAYERLSQVRLDVARIMAWHVRTVFGDALWRTEAGVDLPGGGTKEDWIGQVAARFEELGLG